jgi:hypothetical protein
MGDENHVKGPIRNKPVKRERCIAFFFGMQSRVKHQFPAFQLQKVRISSNLCSPGQIDESHSLPDNFKFAET